MTSVLVTGAAGFIGQRVVKAAEAADLEVIAVAKRPLPGSSIVLDLRGPLDALPVTDWVFHLAGGFAGARLSDLRAADLAIGRNLLTWGAQAGVRNWVFASAAEVYGACRGKATEHSPTRPVIPYGVVKRELEQAFSEFAADQPNAKVAILRIGEVYGAGGTLVDELTRRFCSGFCPWFGNGNVLLSFVHVDDVASAFIRVSEIARSGCSLWNVADDEPITWRAFLDEFAFVLGTRRAVGLPLRLSYLYATTSTAADRLRRRPSTVTRNVVTLLTTPKPMSNGKLCDELGDWPRYPDSCSGLRSVLTGNSLDD